MLVLRSFLCIFRNFAIANLGGEEGWERGWNFPPILEKQSKKSCDEFSRDSTDLTTVSVNKVSKQIWIQFGKFERLKIVQNSVEISRNESENAAFVK